jgi:hypothetical protein
VNQILRKRSSAPYDTEWSNDQDAQWGQVTGTITAQGDLMALLAAKQSVSGMSNYLTLSQALAGYYPLNNPAGYITASAVDIFLTPSEASAIYQTQANMVSYITDADAAIKLEPYCYPRYSNPENYATQSWVTGRNYITASALTGYATESWVTGRGYITTAALSGYATESWVTGLGYLTSGSLSGYAALSGASFSGTVYVPALRNLLNTDLVIDSYNDDAAGTHYLHKFTPFDGKFVLAPNGGGLTFPDGTTQVTSALPLSGGTMTGNITFDGTSGQFIGKGQFDTSRGGNYGISLVCSIGYEFNWQAGWLTTTNQGSSAPRPLYLDSLAGTTLRAWDSSTNLGTEVSHTGLTFADGSTQTTSAVSFDPTGYATESWVTGQGYLTTPFDPTGYAALSGATFTGKVNHTVVGGVAGLNIGVGGTSTASTTAGDMWIVDAGIQINYRDGSGILRTCLVTNASNAIDVNSTSPVLRLTQRGTGNALLVEDSTTPDSSAFAVDASGNVGIGINPTTWAATQKLEVQGGASFSQKVTCTVVAGAAGLNMGIGGIDTASTTAGDIWIGTNNISFKDSSGTQKTVANTNTSNTFNGPQIISCTSTINAALRVTQLGTSNAIEVEDSTSPDATRFVVDQFGKVGVGTAPDATAAIKIDGNGMSFNGLVVNPTSVTAHGNGASTNDLLITINGVQYAIPLRAI